jgi:hypothetical protein
MSGVAPPMSAADVIGGLQISPSILAADFVRLGDHVDQVLAAGARVIQSSRARLVGSSRTRRSRT